MANRVLYHYDPATAIASLGLKLRAGDTEQRECYITDLGNRMPVSTWAQGKSKWASAIATEPESAMGMMSWRCAAFPTREIDVEELNRLENGHLQPREILKFPSNNVRRGELHITVTALRNSPVGYQVTTLGNQPDAWACVGEEWVPKDLHIRPEYYILHCGTHDISFTGPQALHNAANHARDCHGVKEAWPCNAIEAFGIRVTNCDALKAHRNNNAVAPTNPTSQTSVVSDLERPLASSPGAPATANNKEAGGSELSPGEPVENDLCGGDGIKGGDSAGNHSGATVSARDTSVPKDGVGRKINNANAQVENMETEGIDMDGDASPLILLDSERSSFEIDFEETMERIELLKQLLQS
ncbi:hypothetical protein B0T14DRAFT_583812 [Immersiella caudata]|uniref:Uncharacterized protein n=1 Tax=Immersiella caudata TaxID=314043 RepID=A0AA40C452_9PEZI|nr:hypothetical protein B0T14DRAFT_583812 [Immersiella caudata]